MTDPQARPHQDLTEQEIFDRLNQWRGHLREAEHEYEKTKRAAGSYAADEDWGSNIRQARTEIDGYETELQIRHEERRQDRLQREAQRSRPGRQAPQRGNRPPGAETRGRDAVFNWAKYAGGHQKTGFITTGLITYHWQLGGRNYTGYFNPANNTLTVWIAVRPGTPGASNINNNWYLPADTAQQIQYALTAEQQAGQ